jgi:hypothetical protein
MNRRSLVLWSLVLGAWSFAAPAAPARIGETEAEIAKRYGRSLIGDDFHGRKMLVYRKRGIQIGVVFFDGKSAAEFYSKVDKSALSEIEIDGLLQANAANGTWNKTAPSVPLWKLDPTDVTAVYDGRRLTITSPEFIASEKSNREQREKDRLKGF